MSASMRRMFPFLRRGEGKSSKASDDLSKLLNDQGYLFVAEFCEFEGPKILYTYPKILESEKTRPLKSEDKCIKKRLARQFFSSDHCLESSGCNLSLDKEAFIFQEVEVGGKNDQIDTDKDKPVTVYWLGTLFKLYDIHSRGNVKACCIAFVTADLDRITVMRRYWMRVLAGLVNGMKEANLVFHYYQVKKYITLCKDFDRIVRNDQLHREKLTNEGYTDDYYLQESVKAEACLERLKKAMCEKYLSHEKDVIGKLMGIDESESDLEQRLMEKLHKQKFCQSHQDCAIKTAPTRPNLDNIEHFRIRTLQSNSLPNFKQLLGCQVKQIEKLFEDHAAMFNQSFESRLLDNNECITSQSKGYRTESLSMSSNVGCRNISPFVDSLLRFMEDDSGRCFSNYDNKVNVGATLEERYMFENRYKDAHIDYEENCSINDTKSTGSTFDSSCEVYFHPLEESEGVLEFGANRRQYLQRQNSSPFPQAGESSNSQHITESYKTGRSRQFTPRKVDSKDWAKFCRYPSVGKMMRVIDNKRERKLLVDFIRRNYDHAEVRTLTLAALVGTSICLSGKKRGNSLQVTRHITDDMKLVREFLSMFWIFWSRYNIYEFISSSPEKNQISVHAKYFGRIPRKDSTSKEVDIEVPIGMIMSNVTLNVNKKIKPVVPDFTVSDGPILESATTYLAGTNPEFLDLLMAGLKFVHSDSHLILYQTTCLLELIHFANFVLFKQKGTNKNSKVVNNSPPHHHNKENDDGEKRSKDELLDGTLLDNVYNFESKFPSVCFNRKLKNSPPDQTILNVALNNLITYIGENACTFDYNSETDHYSTININPIVTINGSKETLVNRNDFDFAEDFFNINTTVGPSPDNTFVNSNNDNDATDPFHWLPVLNTSIFRQHRRSRQKNLAAVN